MYAGGIVLPDEFFSVAGPTAAETITSSCAHQSPASWDVSWRHFSLHGKLTSVHSPLDVSWRHFSLHSKLTTSVHSPLGVSRRHFPLHSKLTSPLQALHYEPIIQPITSFIGDDILNKLIFISAKWTKWMAEIMRSFDVCLCVCVCVRARAAAGQWELNANSSKTVKATDFKFDTRVPRDSPDMTPKIFPKGGVTTVTRPPKFLGVKC